MLKFGNPTLEESLLPLLTVEIVLTIVFKLLDGVFNKELMLGMSETLGELTGEKVVTFMFKLEVMFVLLLKLLLFLVLVLKALDNLSAKLLCFRQQAKFLHSKKTLKILSTKEFKFFQ